MGSDHSPTTSDDGAGRTRRAVLTAIPPAAIVALAGCMSNSESESNTEASTSTEQTTTATPSSSPTETQTGTEASGSNASSDTLVFTIEYAGDWQGSITADGQQQSIDGYGYREGNITPAPDYAAMSVQKRDKIGELVIAFHYNGEVIQQGSTTADYGVVSISVTA